MGNLSKLKVAIGQPELLQSEQSLTEEIQQRMISRALDAGADLLVLPGSLIDPNDVRIFALNDARIDLAGGRILVEASGDNYTIGIGENDQGCDLSIRVDLEPWSLTQQEKPAYAGIVLRPVGMINADKKIGTFDGATGVYAPDGKLLCRLRDDFEEDFTVMTLDRQGSIAGFCDKKLLTCLVKTMQRFDKQVLPWEPQWIIGLSGGLDSSLSAALLVLAFGSERVTAYSLRSKYNTVSTLSNAVALARSLNIQLKEGSIESACDVLRGTVAEYGYPANSFEGIVNENLQARVRGQLLMTFASLENGVVINNANRIESALGYCTLYGDTVGALAPLADLTKVRLFDLAYSINDVFGSEIIPQNLIPHETAVGYTWQTMPSAELAADQQDPMRWFYHDWLVEQLLDAPSLERAVCSVMERYLDGSLLSSNVGKWLRFYELDTPRAFFADLQETITLIKHAAFKRIQSPPCIKVASIDSIYASLEEQGVLFASERYKTLCERFIRS